MIIDMWKRKLSERNVSQRHFIHRISHTEWSNGWFSAVLSTTCVFYSQNPKKGPTAFWNVMLYNSVKRSHPTGSHLPVIITACPFFEHVLVFRTQHSVSETKFPSVLAVPWIWRLVNGLLPRRPRIKLRPLPLGFMIDEIALGHVLLRVLWFSSVIIIPPMIHNHRSSPAQFKLVIVSVVKIKHFSTHFRVKRWAITCVRCVTNTLYQ